MSWRVAVSHQHAAWAVMLAMAVVSLQAQTPPETQAPGQPTFRTETSLVEVSAVVVDRDGNPVTDLAAADFEILEDGEPRPLVGFRFLMGEATAHTTRPAAVPGARTEVVATNVGPADAPIFVVLLDDLNTSPYNTHRAIRGALGMLDALPAQSLIGVLSTSGIDGAALSLSPPGPEHAERIKQFRGRLILAGPPPHKFETVRTTPSSVSAPCGVGSAVLNSQDCADPTRAERRARTVEALAQTLRRAGARRKVVFWVTEDMGVSPLAPEGSRTAQRAALRAVLDADVAVYPVHPIENAAYALVDESDNDPGQGRPDRRTGNTIRIGTGPGIALDTDDMVAVTLDQIARESGGRWIRKAGELESVLATIVRQNSAAYVLAYESTRTSVPGRHQIDVRVRRADARVYARRGFIVPKAPEATPREGPTAHNDARLADLVQGVVPQGQVAMRLLVAPGFASGRAGRALATLQVDARTTDGQAVDVALVTLDDEGRLANQQGLHLTHPAADDVWEATVNLELTRGTHQVRVAAVTADGTRQGLVVERIAMAEPGRALAMSPLVLLGADAAESGSDGTRAAVFPTLQRTFEIGHPLAAQAEVSGRAVADGGVNVQLLLLRDGDNVAVREGSTTLEAGDTKALARATGVVLTHGLPAGAYTLIAEARSTARDETVRHAVPVTLRANAALTSASGAEAPEADVESTSVTEVLTVAHGPASMFERAGTHVIRTSDEWAAFWRHLPTRQAPPDIDFTRVTLLGVVLDVEKDSAGRRGRGRRVPRIDTARRDGGVMIVRWRAAEETGSDTDDASNSRRPFVVVGITGYDGPVRFVELQ